jgi:hypothetical protein
MELYSEIGATNNDEDLGEIVQDWADPGMKANTKRQRSSPSHDPCAPARQVRFNGIYSGKDPPANLIELPTLGDRGSFITVNDVTQVDGLRLERGKKPFNGRRIVVIDISSELARQFPS